jgi:hypothetical protein
LAFPSKPDDNYGNARGRRNFYAKIHFFLPICHRGVSFEAVLKPVDMTIADFNFDTPGLRLGVAA